MSKTNVKTWTCPKCGKVKESFSTPHDKHDGAWVAFVPPEPQPQVIKRGPGRPRKQLEEQ